MSPHHSPIRGGPSDALERRHVATGGQAGFVDCVRSAAAHVVRWPRTAAPLRRRIELPRRLQAACAALGGDYGGARLAPLLLALPYVRARRLGHLPYLVGGPLLR